MAPDQLISYIQTELLLGLTKEPITIETELVTTGLLDSIAVMRLVSHIEKTLSRRIPEQDMILENFATVGALTEYLNKS